MSFATVKGDVSVAETLSGDRLKYLRLWDAYGALLTDSQRVMCELYYACDLSLSEIAEIKNVTKQAVSDALKKSREQLDCYEEKLHIGQSNQTYSQAVSDMMTRVSRALDSLAEKHPELKGEIGEIADMVCVGEVADPDEEE